MKREEILERAKKENNEKDYATLEIENDARIYASSAILIIISVFFLIEDIILKGKMNRSIFCILSLYNAVLHGYKLIKTHKKNEIIFTLIWGLLSIAYFILYLKNILN